MASLPAKLPAQAATGSSERAASLIREQRFEYPGYRGFRSACRVVISVCAGGPVLVVFSELPHNPGTSITNASEYIATLVYRQHLADVPRDAIRWFEHDPGYGRCPESVDEIRYSWGPRFNICERKQDRGFCAPRWLPVNDPALQTAVMQMLEAT